MNWGARPILAAIAAAALAAAFGGGYVVGKTGAAGTARAAAVEGPQFLWPFFGKPRAANAPRQGEAKPDGFTIWKTNVDTSQADPVSCVTMTRPLDPAKSYSDFVLVNPSLGHPAQASVRGDDQLCVAGLGYSGHQLTLLKGLPAKTGEVLPADLDVDFAAADQPPYVGFDGLGIVLPRQESDGIGIDTVNVSRLHVEVLRVADRNMVRQTIEAPDPTPEGGYTYDDDHNDARSVWAGDVAVATPAGQRGVTVFPLGAVLKDMRPGAYLITARDASGVLGAKRKPDEADPRPARASRWVLFTDMGLAAYDGADALDVVVRSLQSAKTMAGVRVALVAQDGEELASAPSDADGRVRFSHALMEGDGAAKAVRVMAYGPKADFTLLDLDRAPIDLSSQLKGETGRIAPGVKADQGRAAAIAVDGFLYLDRGVYRPGETVRLVALLRDRLAHAVKDRQGFLIVKRPSGTEFQRIRFSGAPNGALAEDIQLPTAAPRGLWKAQLQLDGTETPSGEATFDVQDFAPQRLAVEVTGDASRPLGAGEQRPIAINARFLYGAPGSGLTAQSQATFSADPNPFPQFPQYTDYRWGDELTPFEAKLAQLPDQTTDAAGAAKVVLDASQVADATAPLMAHVSASVLEPGGRPVTESLDLKVRPRSLYLGVKNSEGASGDLDRTETFEVIAVDALGRRVAAPGVAYQLISENWTYDWYEKDGQWNYHRTRRDSPIATGTMPISAAQPFRLTRRLPWGDYRLELSDPASGARTVIRQSAGWGDNAKPDEDPPDAARVAVGNGPYAPGDTVRLHVQAPFAGEVEVAVATDHVISLHTASIGKAGGVVDLKATPEWGGGAYLLVSVMQPRDPAKAPKPRRALGVVYVPLKPARQILTVQLSAPVKLDSKTPLAVPVRIQGVNAGHAHVTLAAVDEGILRLTHQASPNPVDWCFGRRALSVDYRDDYGRLLNPNLAAPAAVNYGGDELGGPALSATPIKTVALWSGIVDVDADGRALIRLPPGGYNGQLRLMAVAWTDDAVGWGQESVLVREPVVAELDLPRFLAPGDVAQIGLELQNVEGRVGRYVAEVTGRGGLWTGFQKLYQLILGQRVLDHLSLTAPPRPSIGAVTLKVDGPGFATVTGYDLQTRMGWDPTTRTSFVLQKPGEAFTPTPDLLSGMAAGDVAMTVSYSPFRGFDPAPIAEQLYRYPFGCSEQLVSVAYPLIYAPELSHDPGLLRTRAALTGAVAKLLDREGLDGAFGLWRPGDAEADPWLGAYIVDFLLTARANGAAVPDDALQRALRGMRLVSRPDGEPDIDYRLSYPGWWGKGYTERMRSRASAYALYDLAKAGQGDLPRLRWYHDTHMDDEPSPMARAQVGAALAMMGDRGRAHDSFVKAVQTLGYRDDWDWYGTPLRDLAGVIALAYEAHEFDIAHQLEGRLEDSVKNPNQLNTQEEARLLQAAHAMLAAAGPIRIVATGALPLTSERWAVGKLADARFVNAGSGPLWRTVSVRGETVVAPPPDSHGLQLRKQFLTLDGRPIDPSHLAQGQRVVVRITGRSGEDRAMLVSISDPLPAGFEAESLLGPDDAAGTLGEDPSHSDTAQQKGPFAFLGALSKSGVQEKRDDRYVAALTVPQHDAFAVAYVARAVTPGDFLLPGAAAQDMYRPDVAAHTAAGRTVIAPAK
jgi:uncharacterized protein YfaS (alpha-2-macroglobulin family)